MAQVKAFAPGTVVWLRGQRGGWRIIRPLWSVKLQMPAYDIQNQASGRYRTVPAIKITRSRQPV